MCRFNIVHKYLISELTRAGRQQQYVLVGAICFTSGGGSICPLSVADVQHLEGDV